MPISTSAIPAASAESAFTVGERKVSNSAATSNESNTLAGATAVNNENDPSAAVTIKAEPRAALSAFTAAAMTDVPIPATEDTKSSIAMTMWPAVGDRHTAINAPPRLADGMSAVEDAWRRLPICLYFCASLSDHLCVSWTLCVYRCGLFGTDDGKSLDPEIQKAVKLLMGLCLETQAHVLNLWRLSTDTYTTTDLFWEERTKYLNLITDGPDRQAAAHVELVESLTHHLSDLRNRLTWSNPLIVQAARTKIPLKEHELKMELENVRFANIPLPPGFCSTPVGSTLKERSVIAWQKWHESNEEFREKLARITDLAKSLIHMAAGKTNMAWNSDFAVIDRALRSVNEILENIASESETRKSTLQKPNQQALDSLTGSQIADNRSTNEFTAKPIEQKSIESKFTTSAGSRASTSAVYLVGAPPTLPVPTLTLAPGGPPDNDSQPQPDTLTDQFL
jgi:hypothetical protein